MKHENMWVAFAAASASAVILGGAATAALAQQQEMTTIIGERETDETRTIRVPYRDLNLAAARDERVLHRRVSGAARELCTGGDMVWFGDSGYEPCVRGAWKGVRPQIALAVRRAQEIAATGTSSIPLVAIAVVGVR